MKLPGGKDLAGVSEFAIPVFKYPLTSFGWQTAHGWAAVAISATMGMRAIDGVFEKDNAPVCRLECLTGTGWCALTRMFAAPQTVPEAGAAHLMACGLVLTAALRRARLNRRGQ